VIGVAGGSARVAAIDWGDEGALLEHLDPPPDLSSGVCGDGGYGLLLGADLVFHAKAIRPLGRTVRALLVGGAGALILAHTSRNAELDAELHSVWADEFGIGLRDVPLHAHHPQHRAPRVQLFVATLST
jgi:hypothetical protein